MNINNKKVAIPSSVYNQTYGGEVEMLCVETLTGNVTPLEEHTRKTIQKCVDQHSEPFIKTKEKIAVGYDSSRHLIEINTGVHESLTSNMYGAISTIKKVSQQLTSEYKSLLSLSFHPTELQNDAYEKNVIKRSIYELCCGQNHIHNSLCAHTLKKIYKSDENRGRGWTHTMSSLAASVQPWNSVSLDAAVDQLMLIQATGWLFILLTASSPFFQAEISGKRDYRLEMWNPQKGMLSTSRYKSDQKLMSNFTHRIHTHAEHSKYLFSIQRPLIIPIEDATEHVKNSFYAIAQPADEKKYSVLELLKSEYATIVDIKTGKKKKIKIKINHILNNKSSLYFPQYGGRFRINMPTANEIDPQEFLHAIESEDETLFMKLLRQGGVETNGFLCIEGRTPAVVLPNNHNSSWEPFCIPFVLQTALLRNYKDIWKYMESTSLTWHDFAFTLPEKANNNSYGFNTIIKGISIVNLAQDIWRIAKESLSNEEKNLIGNEIERILETKKAPAEHQLEFLKHELQATNSKEVSFERLIRNFSMSY